MSYRDREGFGRAEEIHDGTFSVVGPDDQDHAVACDFIRDKGILPCSCDATRRQFSWWWKCWLRWQHARVSRYTWRDCPDRVLWPIMGPDREPWISGVDFN